VTTISYEEVIRTLDRHFPRSSDTAPESVPAVTASMRRLCEEHAVSPAELARAVMRWCDSEIYPPRSVFEFIRKAVLDPRVQARRYARDPALADPDLPPPRARGRMAKAWTAYVFSLMAGDVVVPPEVKGGPAEERWHQEQVQARLRGAS